MKVVITFMMKKYFVVIVLLSTKQKTLRRHSDEIKPYNQLKMLKIAT